MPRRATYTASYQDKINYARSHIMMNEVLPILLATASGLVKLGQFAESVENARAIFEEKFATTGVVRAVWRRKLMMIETQGGPDGYVVLVEE